MFKTLKLIGLMILIVIGILSALFIAWIITALVVPALIAAGLIAIAYMIAKEQIYKEY